MSRLAGQWADGQFKLPRPIAPKMERAFANGYLFLVMCKQSGVLNNDDFEAANDGTTPDIVMKNFTILSKSLKSMILH